MRANGSAWHCWLVVADYNTIPSAPVATMAGSRERQDEGNEENLPPNGAIPWRAAAPLCVPPISLGAAFRLPWQQQLARASLSGHKRHFCQAVSSSRRSRR